MKLICLWLELTDELGLKSVVIDHNDTGLPSDSELLKKVAWALLKSLHHNHEELTINDLMNEINEEND